MKSLPAQSVALTETTKRGVEVANDGRVFGLVQVHHWCGNDPIREHLARVDLGLLLDFLGEGEPIGPPISPIPGYPVPVGGTFSPAGWEIGEYFNFCLWSDVAPSDRVQLENSTTTVAHSASVAESN